MTPVIFGGVFPGGRADEEAEWKLHALLAAGITTFIDLTEPGERPAGGTALRPYEDLMTRIARGTSAAPERVSIPIRDANVGTDDQVTYAIDSIDRAVHDGGRVYVHCWGGKGRTGLVLGCYLARSVGPDAVAVMNRIRTPQVRHPNDQVQVPETSAQRAMIESWDQDTARAST